MYTCGSDPTKHESNHKHEGNIERLLSVWTPASCAAQRMHQMMLSIRPAQPGVPGLCNTGVAGSGTVLGIPCPQAASSRVSLGSSGCRDLVLKHSIAQPRVICWDPMAQGLL